MEKRTSFIENGIYHVYNRGNGSEAIFRNFRNYDYFLKKYYEYMTPYWDTMAWCLMPNHFHLLVRIKKQPEDILTVTELCTKAYSDFCNGYVQAFNKEHFRKGSLFMRSYKRKPAFNDEYIRKLVCYIHNNPVKDGYARHPRDWYHSSFCQFDEMSEHQAKNDPVVRYFGSKADFLHAHILELNPGTIDLNSRKYIGEFISGDLPYSRARA